MRNYFYLFLVFKPKVRHTVAETFGSHLCIGPATGSQARASAASLRRAAPGYQPSQLSSRITRASAGKPVSVHKVLAATSSAPRRNGKPNRRGYYKPLLIL